MNKEECLAISNELFALAKDPAISNHLSTVLNKLANRLNKLANRLNKLANRLNTCLAVDEKPVAWLWECINGPYAGEIDVYSVTTPIDRKEVERVKGLYSEPFPVYK